MSATAKLRAEALALPEDDRLDLAAELVASVHDGMTPEWEAAWVAECRRRVAQVDAGEVTPIPADEVMENLRARLAAPR
ncbi:MAG: addiction module protein [Kofleriaceae bacterium]